MEVLSTLENLAEVGVAITGFAGIVAAVAHSSSGGWSASDRGNFRALVLWSLGAAFLAYLPVILVSLDAPDPALWRLSNAIFAVFHVYVFWETSRSIRDRPESLTRGGIFLFVFGALVLFAEIAAAAGPLASIAASVYLTAVVWFLFIAATRFLALVDRHFGTAAE